MTLPLAIYTAVHVVISLVAIVTGFVVAAGFVYGKHHSGWTAWFLATTVLTSVTGFGFPIHGLTPGHVVGAISLVVLGFALYALYSQHLGGHWREAYIVNSLVALYLNVFVLIVQSFGKVPVLKALAPTQTEFPFAATQLAALVGFVVVGAFALSRFRKVVVV